METILPVPQHLELVQLVADSRGITAVVRPKAEQSRCPCCGCLSSRVPYIYQRWNGGCRNGSQMHRELVEQGVHAALRTVTRYHALS